MVVVVWISLVRTLNVNRSTSVSDHYKCMLVIEGMSASAGNGANILIEACLHLMRWLALSIRRCIRLQDVENCRFRSISAVLTSVVGNLSAFVVGASQTGECPPLTSSLPLRRSNPYSNLPSFLHILMNNKSHDSYTWP